MNLATAMRMHWPNTSKKFDMKNHYFPPSQLADQYLRGLKGLEVGASAHNSYYLDTINVDFTNEFTVYKQEEVNMCGKYAPVDIVADAKEIPVDNESFDFVISSHMLEHHWDPISVVIEWARIAKQYIFITVPRKDLTFDKDKPVTPVHDLVRRYTGALEKLQTEIADDHWSIWDVNEFRNFVGYMCALCNLEVVAFQEIDDKVGNGMTVLFKKRSYEQPKENKGLEDRNQTVQDNG